MAEGKNHCDDECKNHSGIMADIRNLQASDDRQWNAINSLKNRLPLWATLLITGLSSVACIAITKVFN